MTFSWVEIMLSIETYVLIAIVCLLDLSGADFYNSTGFSAYTWPGLVSLTALIDNYATEYYILTRLQPFLPLYDACLMCCLSSLRNYPQSCLCAENGVRRDNCNLFKCGCICDVTAGKCDYNCCCDPDCSAEQVRILIIYLRWIYQTVTRNNESLWNIFSAALWRWDGLISWGYAP